MYREAILTEKQYFVCYSEMLDLSIAVLQATTFIEPGLRNILYHNTARGKGVAIELLCLMRVSHKISSHHESLLVPVGHIFSTRKDMQYL